jgi:hypothetical protein
MTPPHDGVACAGGVDHRHLGRVGVIAAVRGRGQRGAWPTSCYPLYPVDGEELLRYVESCPEGFEEYLRSFLAQAV